MRISRRVIGLPDARTGVEDQPVVGEALAVAVDAAMGKGHVVMFATRPYWRWQTQGTFFLGFNAIGRIRIVQKPVRQAQPVKRRLRALSADEKAGIGIVVSGMEAAVVRSSLVGLGASVRASRKP